jgi:hypothetical protein
MEIMFAISSDQRHRLASPLLEPGPMTKTAQLVKDLAETRRVTLYTDQASFLADQLNRIEGVEGDETLRLIADLMRAKAISSDEGGNLVLAHVRELASAVVDGAGAGNELG